MTDEIAPPENVRAVAFAYFGVLAPAVPVLGEAATRTVERMAKAGAAAADEGEGGAGQLLPLIGYTLDQHADDAPDHGCRLTPAATLIYETLLAVAGEPPSVEVVEQVLNTFGALEAVPPRAEVLHVLEGLVAAEMPLGLLVNCLMPGQFVREQLRAAGVEDLFATIVYAADWGWCQPHPSVFRELADGLEVPPEQILFVPGLFRLGVQGAEAAGFRTAWLRPDLDRRVQAVESSYIIRDLDILLDWFGGTR